MQSHSVDPDRKVTIEKIRKRAAGVRRTARDDNVDIGDAGETLIVDNSIFGDVREYLLDVVVPLK